VYPSLSISVFTILSFLIKDMQSVFGTSPFCTYRILSSINLERVLTKRHCKMTTLNAISQGVTTSPAEWVFRALVSVSP
jgi:hypothetical protein